MPKRIYVDIETLPPDERVREQLAVELVRHCQGNTPSGVAPVSIEEEFRKLALSGEMGRVLVTFLPENSALYIKRGTASYSRSHQNKLAEDQEQTEMDLYDDLFGPLTRRE